MRGIFVTGTGTDIGKTYVSTLICKHLVNLNYDIAYYKAAISGALSTEESDAGCVKKFAGLKQKSESLLSYLYKDPLSPHLAARIENNFANLDKIKEDFTKVALAHDLVLVEGSGGIVCPIVYEKECKILLEDIIKSLGLNVIVVADAGLGTINQVTLTCNYLKSRNFKINGIIFNNFEDGNLMHQDNLKMVEALNDVKVIATVSRGGNDLKLRLASLVSVFDEIYHS